MGSEFLCLACKRWKLFDDKPCAEHPDFKTAKEIAEAEASAAEAEQWRKAEESMKVMMYTAGLRTTAAMGRPDLLENLNRNLSRESEEVQANVVAEVQRMGLMTGEEVTQSILMYLELQRQDQGR